MQRIYNSASTSKILGAALLTATFLLSGCGSTKEVFNIDGAAERNPGKCPSAFALYDAARIIDFRGDAQAYENVGFTGEVEKVRSLCRYYGTAPIQADMEITFSLGRGPAATQDTATYEYFVAVMRKNIAVIEKEVFPLTVTFEPGQDRVTVTEKINNIVIPRKAETTSGANFEIVTGFVLTPQQKAFNAEGKRFRISAGKK